jgi:hypothetical protein
MTKGSCGKLGMQVVYNPQKRIDELTMELNSSSSMAVSNLTLFSPSKVCTMQCYSLGESNFLGKLKYMPFAFFAFRELAL